MFLKDEYDLNNLGNRTGRDESGHVGCGQKDKKPCMPYLGRVSCQAHHTDRIESASRKTGVTGVQPKYRQTAGTEAGSYRRALEGPFTQ